MASECMSSIELLGIEDLDMASEVGVKNDAGVMERKMMLVRLALMDIKVPGTDKPLFLMITTNRDGDCEGVLPTGRV